MKKSVKIGVKPTTAKSADNWVTERTATKPNAEKMKRLTIDVSESLHRRIKSTCANEGVKMADEIRKLLESRFE